MIRHQHFVIPYGFEWLLNACFHPEIGFKMDLNWLFWLYLGLFFIAKTAISHR
jgi:hypothetical protein